jgi:hypothetical protein
MHAEIEQQREGFRTIFEVTPGALASHFSSKGEPQFAPLLRVVPCALEALVVIPMAAKDFSAGLMSHTRPGVTADEHS